MLATQADLHVYRLRVVPRAFALTLVEIQDIYLNLSVPEIIKEKLQRVALGGEPAHLDPLARELGGFDGQPELVLECHQATSRWERRRAIAERATSSAEAGGPRCRDERPSPRWAHRPGG